MSYQPGGPPPPPGEWPGYGQPPFHPSTAPSTSSKAITSLVLGLVGLFFAGLFTGIPAMVVGFMARREVRESGGRITGDGLALGGIITGALATLWSLVLAALIVGLLAVGVSVSGDADRPCVRIGTSTAEGAASQDCL
jgi:Domain of unknown function (DUF4190)